MSEMVEKGELGKSANQPAAAGDAEKNPCWVRMEDDDESGMDILTFGGILNMADMYCGQKQIKRYWLINDHSRADMELRISLEGRDQDSIQSGELFIDGTGILAQTDEQPSRVQCVTKYEEQHRLNSSGLSAAHGKNAPTGPQADQDPVASMLERSAAGSQSEQTFPVCSSHIGTLQTNAQLTGSLTAPGVLQSSQSLLESSTLLPGTGLATLTAGHSGKRRPPASAPLVPKNSRAAVTVSGTNLQVEAEFETAVGWEHIREGNNSSRRGGERQGISAAKALSSSGGSKGAGQRVSTSKLCARQWGQDGVIAELCGYAHGADADKDGREAAEVDALGLSDRRYFVGGTARAAKLSKASKTLARLHASKKGAPPTSTGATACESEPTVPAATAPPAGEQGLVDGPATAAAVDLLQLGSAEAGNTVRELPRAQECVFRAVLKPQERLQVAVIVCPSAYLIDDSTGGRVEAELVAKEISLLAQWRLLHGEDSSAPHSISSGEHPLSVRFRCCRSVIAVTPNEVYELGMCNVGEQRTLTLDVSNKSPLAALVYPYVQSEVLDVSDQDELVVPPFEIRQLRISYLAREEQMEYSDRVVLLNAFDDAGHREVRVKARNLDTEQVVLHSMFYKLVTYNSLRQLQVSFERALFNMPNVRVFSVKNVHVQPLRMTFSWNKSAGMRLFVVSAPSDDGAASVSTGARGAPEVQLNDSAGSVLSFRPGARQAVVANSGGGSNSSSQHQQQEEIEDLKWGDSALEFTPTSHAHTATGPSSAMAAFTKSLTRQAMKRSMSLYSKGGGGSGGDDGAVNYGKGSVADPKQLSVGTSSADIVSVLDLSQASTSFVTSSITPSAVAVEGSEGGPVEVPSLPSPTPSSKQGTEAVREVRFMDATEDSSAAASAGQGEPSVVSITTKNSTGAAAVALQSNLVMEVLEVCGRDSFPFSLVEDATKLADGDESRSQASAPDLSADERIKLLKEGGKSVSRSAQEEGGRPHSLGGPLGPGVLPETSAASLPKERERSEAELCVKRIQKAYADLRAALEGGGAAEGGCFEELALDANTGAEDGPGVSSASITIPLGATVRFAVVYEPPQRAEFEDPEEYTLVRVSESLHIRLPDVDAAEVATCLERSGQSSGQQGVSDDPHLQDEPLALPTGGLRPRSLPIRASLVRSEMVVIQKNINFGRTVLNDKSSRGVTIVNRSSVPCLFSISKSGSISSGFLQVLGGRKGIISPFSSKVVEFIFKPSMAGNFEEVLMFNNVLNPRDAQAVTIKAKVHHTETFVLCPAGAPAENSVPRNAGAERGENLGTAEANDAARLVQHLANVSAAHSQTSSAKAISHFLGNCIMMADTTGPQSSHLISFSVRNVTSKSRQFIVDATHAHAIELLIAPTSQNSPAGNSAEQVQSPGSVVPTSPDKLLATTPFEPIPEVLQSILSLRCRFDSEVVRSGGGQGDGGAPGEGALSRDERQQLEDSLEQFQQKLKIAIRKNKQEKIEKYQKKIDKVIVALQENKSQATPAPGASAPGGLLKTAPSTSTIATDGDLTESPAVQGAPNAAAPPASNESEVSFHFQLEPEQERMVHVRLTFLPGPSYRSWSGLLPFHGFLRVFECKNEDHVKVVHFGAMVRTGRLSVTSAVPFSQSEASKGPLDSPSLERRDSITEYRSLAADVPFITTVAQWSSLPTREIYPKYRQLPQNLLPMCVKLVRASTERVMHGSFSVASLLEHAGMLTLSLDEDFSTKASPEYATYNAQRHGEVLFALATTVLREGVAAERQPTDLVLGESSSLAAEIGSKPSARSKKDSIVRCLTHQSSSRLKAGSKVDFSVQWRPPIDLSSSSKQHQSVAVSGPNSTAGEEGHTAVPQALRIVGAIKVQLRISDKVVGQAQSIPFVGVLEHRSAISVSKHFVCEGACVGSYRSYQLPIQNTSAEHELHYVVSAEELAGNSKSLGSLEIVSGQTGIIRPGGSKHVSLLFCASSAGRFEQKLWVRNIRDMFDQKRVVVQANIAVAQTKFVVFPDLESSDAVGKYKTVDLGLIQIQSAAGSADPELESLLPREAEARCFYELRIQNVSGKPLSVTAVSNLKSQCYIYADEDCRQLAIFAPLPTATTTSLYVKIKPSPVGAPDLAGDGPESGLPGGESKKAAVAAGAGGGGRGTRELMGGVKLVFFTSEAAAASPTGEGTARALTSADPSLAEVTPRKLFESAISFKATVGRSVLKMSSGAAPTMCCVSNDSAPSASTKVFAQRFELRNASKIFPLDYAYLLRPGDSCTESSRGDTTPLSEDSPGRPDVRMTVADAAQGRLEPGQSKWVTCYVHVPVGAHGVVLCTVRAANLSTLETLSLTLSTFLDPGHITVDGTVDGAATGGREGGQVNGGQDVAVVEAQRMLVRNSDTCLWAYRNTAEVAAKLMELNRSAVRTNSDSDISGAPTLASGGLASLVVDALVVQGSAPGELCTWPVRNNRNSAIIVFPASDLPVEVTLVRPGEESAADAAAAVPLLAARSDSDVDTQNIAAPAVAGREYVSTISPALLRWKSGLVRCGDAYNLEPGVEYKVVVRPKPGAVLKEKHAGIQEGKVVRLQGVVVFLQAAHSLQSLFDPAHQREPSATSAPTASDSSRDAGTGVAATPGQLSVIPVVSVSHIACSLASPLLRLPVKEVTLGRKRYGAVTGFQLCVENPSEVDVPACLDSLPSWMSIEKFALSALAPLSRGDDGGVSLDWAAASGRTGSAKATVAQKLHWWIATNGATISGTDTSATPKRRGSKDSSISYEEWQLALSDAGSTSESGQLASGTGTEKEDDDMLTTTGDVESVGGRPRTGSADLTRQHQSDLSLSTFDSELLRSRKVASGHGDGASLRFFGIPAQSRIYLNIQAKVPVTGATVLRHELRIKNLSSCLVGGGGGPRARYVFDEQGGVAVADEHALRVSVEVDATPALEIIPAIDEPLVTRSQLSFGGTVKSAEAQFHAAFVRLLKDPVVVPPPVDVTLDERTEPAAGARPSAIQAKSKVPKSHCRFSVKNKLPDSVRVKATVDVSAELASVFDIKVKFQTSNSDSIDLVHEESSGVKVRVVPKQSGRLRDSGAAPTPVTLVRLPSLDGGAGEDRNNKDTRDSEQILRGRTPTLQGVAADPTTDLTAASGPAGGAGAAGHYRASPALAQLAAHGGKRAVEQLVASLLGTVRLTPYALSTGGVADGPPIEVALDSDMVTVDLVGQLQAGPTSAASACAPSAPTPPSLATSDAAAATAPLPGPTPAPNMVLEFRAVPAPAQCAEASENIKGWNPFNGQMLCLAAPSVTFYLSNPSSTSELNYSVKAQSYRHAGMGLLLRTEGQEVLNAHDTFLVCANPARGSIPPSTFVAVTLSLVPGDPANAVKAASTLTSDIPDPQMRERRLRSHHRDGGGAAVTGVLGAGGSAPRLVAGLPGGDAVGSTGASSAESAQAPATLGNPPTKAGPFTVACMPVEIYDLDFPVHPPRVLWTYFTSEVPLSVVPTQSMKEWSLSRGQGPAPRRGLLARIPSEMGENRFEPIVEGQVGLDTSSASALPLAISEREEVTPRTPAATSAAPAASTWAEEVLVPMALTDYFTDTCASDAVPPVVLLNAGSQTQRKESLEWTVTLSNASEADLSITLIPVFSADASWLTLSQTGGLLPGRGRLSFMVYVKRSMPVGCYASYVQVVDRNNRTNHRFLLVSMEIVSEAKRTGGALPPVPSAPRIASSSAENLPALGGLAADVTNERGAPVPLGAASIQNASRDCQDMAVDAAVASANSEPERQSSVFALRQDGAARNLSSSRLASMTNYAVAADSGAERRRVVMFKALFQVHYISVDKPDNPSCSERSTDVCGGDGDCDGDGTVGLPLTPIPSPSGGARKRLAQGGVSPNVMGSEETRLSMSVVSCADIPLSVLVRCIPAPGVAAGTKLLVSGEADNDGGVLSEEVEVVLSARQSTGLWVHVAGSDGNCIPSSTCRLVRETAGEWSWDGVEVRSGERPVGCILVDTPLVPNQQQVLFIVASHSLPS